MNKTLVDQVKQVVKLRKKGYDKHQIAKELGLPESTVRAWLKGVYKEKDGELVSLE